MRDLLLRWFDPSTLCANGNIADFSVAQAAVTGSNCVPLTLGAGAGAKVTAMYQIKYIVKEGDMIQVFASILMDAHERVRTFASTAVDSGPAERTALHEAQSIQNLAQIEMPLTRASCVAVGIPSSAKSHNTRYIHAWQHAMTALAASSSPSSQENEDDNGHDDDGASNCDNDGARCCRGPTANETDCGEDNMDDHRSDDSLAENEDLAAFARVVDRDVEDMVKEGFTHAFSKLNADTKEVEWVRYTDAETYAYRDARLNDMSAYEFHVCYHLRSNAADKYWLAQELKKKQPTRTLTSASTVKNENLVGLATASVCVNRTL